MLNKRKQFPRVALDIKASPAAARAKYAKPVDTKVYYVSTTDSTRARTHDFAPWYGKGIDAVTYECQQQIAHFIEDKSGNRTAGSIDSYCKTGLPHFLNFLITRRNKLQRDIFPKDINRGMIDDFLEYLAKCNLQTSSQNSIYSHTKSVLIAMAKRKVYALITSGDESTFPTNPHPGMRRGTKGASPLPRRQRTAFTDAVKAEVLDLFKEGAKPTGEILAYALLIVALHTGRNTVPLLELTTDCLQPHPKRGLRFLVVRKRRARRTHAVAVNAEALGVGSESAPAVRPTVVRLIQRVIELTAPLRLSVAGPLRTRLWLYESRGGDNFGDVIPLAISSIEMAASKLVAKHKLEEPDGSPMRINCSRLRKTFINRVNEILEDNVAVTAAAAGNTPQVLGSTYLRPGENAKKNWRFMGIILAQELQRGTIGSTEKTPVARCTNVTAGEFAPQKEGAFCMSFLNCLRCRNCVITGDDLHKIFSLYWRVYRERGNMQAQTWKKRLAHIPRIIDRDVVPQGIQRNIFTQKQVDECRNLAKSAPHPFWAGENLLGSFE